MNRTQRKTLHDTLRLAVDVLLENRQAEYKEKVEWVNSILRDNPTISESTTILKRCPNLISDLREATNISVEIRSDWRAIAQASREDNPVISNEILARLKRIPNYNPILIASMQKFEETVSNLQEDIKVTLIRLRELYLEMSPMSSYSYGDEYRTFHFRLGDSPLNLNNFGPCPLAGEIQEDVKDYLEERLQLYKEHNAEMLERETDLNKKHDEEMLEQKNALNKKHDEEILEQKNALNKKYEDLRDELYKIAEKCAQNGDVHKAIEWLNKAAKQGQIHAQFELAIAYDSGHVVQKDVVKAVEWYQKAAEQGHAKAQFRLGCAHYKGQGISKDIAKAIQWWERAASQEHPEAQFQLGKAYDFGQGVTKDPVKAVEWYQKAAIKEHPEAQFNLAVAYDEGEGVLKNITKAIEWYQKAAIQGYAKAQYNLASKYYEGLGVTKDKDKVVEWLEKAASQGLTKAKNALDELSEDVKTRNEQPKNENNRLYAFSLHQNQSEDPIETFKKIEKSANEGNASAQYVLAEAYDSGQGVPVDAAKAVMWWKRAAEQNHPKAQCALGYAYNCGQGVLMDAAKAVMWYQKAAEQGVRDAQYYLAISYEAGLGIEKDITKANELYSKAAEQGHKLAKKILALD